MRRIFIKKCFLFKVRSVCRESSSQLGGKRFASEEEVEIELRKGPNNSQKTSAMRVSGHW
jgi:hypothetical protein